MAKRKSLIDDTLQNQLVQVHQGPHVTNVGIEKVLRFVRDHGLPEHFSDTSQTRAVKKTVDSLETDYGPTLVPHDVTLSDGAVEVVYIIHPFAILHLTCSRCPAFRELLRARLAMRANSYVNPWGVILYFDEVTPTDALSSKLDQRKVQSVYWTLDVFSDLLFCEELWFVLAVTRSVIVEDTEIQMCGFINRLLDRFFFPMDGHNFRRSGITLPLGLGDGPVRLFIDHRITIADFKAIKEVLLSMGHGGTVPCPICMNVVKKDWADYKSLWPLTGLDLTKWKPHTDASLKLMLTEMGTQKPHLGKTAFEALETRKGYHYHDDHIALNANLNYKAISTLLFDWPHIYVVKGVFNYEIEGFFDLVREATPKGRKAYIRYEDLNDHMHNWEWPRHQRSCRESFASGKVGASASDLMRAVPAIRDFCRAVICGEASLATFHGAAESLALCCDAVEKLQCASRKLLEAPELHDAIMAHLRKNKEVYGDELWYFKHHQATHIAKMYAELGFLVDSLVGERKHRNPKRYATPRKSRLAYERGVMSDLLLQHLADWSNWSLSAITYAKVIPLRLQSAVAEAFPGVPMDNIKMGDEYRGRSGAKFCKGDLVLLSRTVGPTVAGRIWYHFRVNGNCTTCISVWQFIESSKDGTFRTYAVVDQPQLFDSTALHSSCIYRIVGDRARVMVPLAYRLQ